MKASYFLISKYIKNWVSVRGSDFVSNRRPGAISEEVWASYQEGQRPELVALQNKATRRQIKPDRPKMVAAMRGKPLTKQRRKRGKPASKKSCLK